VDLLFPVEVEAAAVAVVLLVLVVLAARVAAARWRPCVVCPFPFLPAGAVVAWAAAAVVWAAVVVVAGVGVTTPRAGMGHLALCKVTGHAAVLVVAVFPAHFAMMLAWRRLAAVVVPVTLVLQV